MYISFKPPTSQSITPNTNFGLNCVHATPVEVFPTVWAGSAPFGRISPIVPKDATLVDLSGRLTLPFSTEGFVLPIHRKRLRISWPDFNIPGLGREDWSIIAAELQTHPSIYVACTGGHGRTGSFLSILGGLWGLAGDGEDPILVVRKRYCDKAVETLNQVNYIEEILGYKSTAIIEPLSQFSPLYSYPLTTPQLQTWDSKATAVVPSSSRDCFALSYERSDTQSVETRCLPHKCGKIFNHLLNHACNKCLHEWLWE